MIHTIARLAGLVALFCPSVLGAAVPSGYNAPEVPWKKDGLVDIRNADPHRRSYGDGCKNGPDSRHCWTGDFTLDTDMDERWPDTGKTVTYNFEITNTTLSPDGVPRMMYVVNGQYPGPTIYANWGDTIVVNVKNSLTTNGTGVHWHGMRMLGTNEMDGVSGVTECPIAPGGTKVYTFKATQYGTSWYHSHYAVQYGEGLIGGIVINGPSSSDYDIDLGFFPFTDWFHETMFTTTARAIHQPRQPAADNILVNGSMTFQTGGKYAVTHLTYGKKHLLRLANTGINNFLHVALDGHTFTVVAADLIPIVPFETDSLVLAVGQRYDVIIDACQPVANYWFRVGTGGECDGPNKNGGNIRSIFQYEGATSGSPNSTGALLPTGCHDQEGIVPYAKTSIPQDVPENLRLNFTQTAAKNNLVQWLINDSSFKVNYMKPTLQSIVEGNTTFSPDMNVYDVGEAHKWQYWVIQQGAPTPPLPHPIHLHGHDFYVLDHQANTTWNGDISRLKMDNPPRRDTATLPEGGYIVIAFESDNPGIWLMHCHIPFHSATGFALQFLEREGDIVHSLGDLGDFEQGCKAWDPFQQQFFPNGLLDGESGI
ncbi:laccase [Polyplosphaeria fusca]|uniref:Laccase n=1 Tax=Polyplosphaeria fusca TaxID=682080 RepID=A0A9P4R3I0_9PLEO|nr:laccase [Polyplosphaeria fusca]